jgi:hypothetical protein
MDLFLDAKDSVNNWCVARIIDHDLQNYKIKIHFDGWSPRYDEVSFFFLFNQNLDADSKNKFQQNWALQKVHARLHWAEECSSQRIHSELCLLGNALKQGKEDY